MTLREVVLVSLLSGLFVTASAAPVLGVDACRVKVDKRTGTLLVDAKGVEGALRWGGGQGSEDQNFSNEVDCVQGEKAKRCQLGDAMTADAITPPAGCMIYLADDGAETCSAFVPGCTPGFRGDLAACRVETTPSTAMGATGAVNTLTLTATCDANEIALTGGFDIGSFSFGLTCVPSKSERSGDSGWSVSWYSPPNDCASNSFNAWALCCPAGR